MATAHAINLDALHARLPDFWWSEVERIRRLIQQDPTAACFEAEYLEYASEALALAEDVQLAHEHAPALWAASHQLKMLARVSSPKARAARRPDLLGP